MSERYDNVFDRARRELFESMETDINNLLLQGQDGMVCVSPDAYYTSDGECLDPVRARTAVDLTLEKFRKYYGVGQPSSVSTIEGRSIFYTAIFDIYKPGWQATMPDAEQNPLDDFAAMQPTLLYVEEFYAPETFDPREEAHPLVNVYVSKRPPQAYVELEAFQRRYDARVSPTDFMPIYTERSFTIQSKNLRKFGKFLFEGAKHSSPEYVAYSSSEPNVFIKGQSDTTPESRQKQEEWDSYVADALALFEAPKAAPRPNRLARFLFKLADKIDPLK